MVKRSIASVTLDNLSCLPEPCNHCGYWEQRQPASLEGGFLVAGTDKKDWYDTVLSEWGPCGKLVFQLDQALAYCQYAPASLLPQISYYKLGPVSLDAIFLSCLFVPPVYRGRGLGKLMINAVQKDLIKRGYRAIETFARRAPAKNPSGWIEFFLANGWQVVKESGSIALLRLDLRASVTWQINLDSVLQGLPISLPPKVKVPMPG